MHTKNETAYRHLKSDLSDVDLAHLYTPTAVEIRLLKAITNRPWQNLALTIHYKVFRYLGYFESLSKIPERIKAHIAQCLGFSRLPPAHRLEGYDQGRHRRSHFAAIREHLGVRPFSPSKYQGWLEETARVAAHTKHNVPDIINQLIEELVREKFELPGFTTLENVAVIARTQVHDEYLGNITQGLSRDGKATIDQLLKPNGSPLTGWNSLKREPRKPTNKEARFWLHHIERLSRLANQLPVVKIPAPKLRFFRDWARAYDATQMSRQKPNRRYGLAAILVHFQLSQALDDAVELYTRFLQRLENRAIRELAEHRDGAGQEKDELVAQLRAIAQAALTKGSASQRLQAIDDSFLDDPESIISLCDAHLLVRHKDFIPFLLEPYTAVRAVLMNCLEIVNLQALQDDSDTLKLLAALRSMRAFRKKRLVSLAEIGLEVDDLAWLSDVWRRHVFTKSLEGQPQVDRNCLELAIHFRIRAQIKSGDLFVPKGEKFDDIRDHMIGDDQFPAELEAYGLTTGIQTDTPAFINDLKQMLTSRTKCADKDFPNNPFATINDGKLSLKRVRREDQSPEVGALESLISERMHESSIVDVITDACRWVDLSAVFRTVSGEKGRLKDLFSRVVSTLVCYGCNLGPVQTSRSLKTVSRKQVSWINLQYVTETMLDEAITKVVNRFDEYRLPKFWGSGRSASADGTKWGLYEQNMISERHIRYGGYGGIGYYHVSDRYIALMSHFTTCGTHEAIYILDGLLNNKSSIQPDTVHGDTQAQSLPVFALSYLLGIRLMPRIRNMKDLTFSRVGNGQKIQHIDSLFKDTIDWKIIEDNLTEMMRVVVSIKMGLVTSSAILRRLGTHSRKNPLYFAFRELGKVIRTCFMLEYINDIEVRKKIQAATNKSEQFNRFVKLIFFGGEGIIAENVRHEQRKMVKYAHLVANLVVLHNVNQMTRILHELELEGIVCTAEAIRGVSPFRMGHIDRLGNYVLDLDRQSEKSLQHIEIQVAKHALDESDEEFEESLAEARERPTVH